jgi:hypothetical protein
VSPGHPGAGPATPPDGFGQGGAGDTSGDSQAGGGGGGYFGGGGGGLGVTGQQGCDGSGGGGSGFAGTGVTVQSTGTNRGDGSVRFTYAEPASTTTSLTADPAGPVVAGTRVTLTAQVAPSGAAGTVTFRDGGTVVGTATLSGGQAQLNITATDPGRHDFTATYSGAVGFLASASSTVTLVVTAPPTSTPSTPAAQPAEPAEPTVSAELAATGASTTPVLAAAFALLVFGGVLLGAAGRIRPVPAESTTGSA